MGLLAGGATRCRPPTTNVDVPANTHRNARLCSKGACLGVQVAPGPSGHSPGLRPSGCGHETVNGACACSQAQLSASSALRLSVSSVVFVQEHGCPPPRVLHHSCGGGLDEGREGPAAVGGGHRASDAEVALRSAPAICFPECSLVHIGCRDPGERGCFTVDWVPNAPGAMSV